MVSVACLSPGVRHWLAALPANRRWPGGRQRPRPRLTPHPVARTAEGVKAEAAYAKDKTLPDPNSTTNPEFKIVLSIIKDTLQKVGGAAV